MVKGKGYFTYQYDGCLSFSDMIYDDGSMLDLIPIPKTEAVTELQEKAE